MSEFNELVGSDLPEYTVAIRTLGTAGEKYQRCLDSLMRQTHLPKAIHVYLANNYPDPKETVGIERIIRVPKGMVAQRALKYDDVTTEWILFTDDDMEFGPCSIESMFHWLQRTGADVIAPDAIPHRSLPTRTKFAMAILGSAKPRMFSRWGYTVNCSGSYNYNPAVREGVRRSTTNAGACFVCRKEDFCKIHFENDLWLDQTPYAIPDDMVMFYKMHLNKLKILTQYSADIVHLDAGAALTDDRERNITYSLARNKYIFYRMYVRPNLSIMKKLAGSLWKAYQYVISFLYYGIIKKRNPALRLAHRQGIRDARKYLREG